MSCRFAARCVPFAASAIGRTKGSGKPWSDAVGGFWRSWANAEAWSGCAKMVRTTTRRPRRPLHHISTTWNRRSIPPGIVAPPSNTPGILGRRAFPLCALASWRARLGALA
jgi:hypothetical protein